MKSNRTIATDISNDVRKRVRERDHDRCIFCRSTYNLQLAHIIPRSRGGRGVEKNLVTACAVCHHNMDFTQARRVMLKVASDHVRRHHGIFDEEEVIYRKGKGYGI